jgi:H2-forming N5,N10-methylenetetrahydromethanopterin dehydrogenase-like enzyme
MKKFEGWATAELQFLASLIAARGMEFMVQLDRGLYDEIIREIRNRRIKEELFQMKLEGIEEE